MPTGSGYSPGVATTGRGKYPRIVDALACFRVRSIIVDGEAAWCGKDGKSNFDKLHSHELSFKVVRMGRRWALKNWHFPSPRIYRPLPSQPFPEASPSGAVG